MGIFGIGIDILEINRIKKNSIYKNDIFAKRILSKQELCTYFKNKNKPLFLSKRFVIKEAISKAFGYGIQKGFYFKTFEVYHNNLGQPKIRLFDNTLKFFNKMNLKSISISLSDEKNYVCAIVVIEN